MGLFEGVTKEVQEMFVQYIWGKECESVNYKVARQIFGIGKGLNFFARTDGCLTLNEYGLSVTKFRNEVFYKRAGQIIAAYELFKTGLYSLRQVSRLCQISTNTASRLLHKMDNPKCVCGIPLLIHRGWCRYRFENSEKRKKVIQQWQKA